MLTRYPCIQAIEAFQKDPPTTVFLLSMRSGAVGINLTAANHVFLMDPAFNPALEDQAVGRAHRMAQTRPVTVKKFYIKVHSLLQNHPYNLLPMRRLLPMAVCAPDPLSV